MTEPTAAPGIPPEDLGPLLDAALPADAPGAWIAGAIDTMRSEATGRVDPHLVRAAAADPEHPAHDLAVGATKVFDSVTSTALVDQAPATETALASIVSKLDGILVDVAGYATGLERAGDRVEKTTVTELYQVLDMVRRTLDQPSAGYRAEKLRRLVQVALELELDQYRALAVIEEHKGLMDEAGDQADRVHELAGRVMVALAADELLLPATLLSDLRARAQTFARWVDSLEVLAAGSSS